VWCLTHNQQGRFLANGQREQSFIEENDQLGDGVGARDPVSTASSTHENYREAMTFERLHRFMAENMGKYHMTQSINVQNQKIPS
jgi:uncharacterized protein YoaH (UPF0181 family)